MRLRVTLSQKCLGKDPTKFATQRLTSAALRHGTPSLARQIQLTLPRC